MATGALADLADQLEADGFEAAELRELQDELDALERPPGLLRRLSSKAREVAAQQWANLVGELRESGEAMQLITASMRGKKQLTEEERDKVRAQLLDLVRVFPAGIIAVANSAFPIPGTGLFTPWILLRLGLMPSHWREAHLVEQLRKQQRELSAAGRRDQAERIGAMADRIEHEAEERDRVRHESELLTCWDKNQNGQWDPEEIEAYLKELARVRELARTQAARKEWYFSEQGEVYGAERLSELEWDAEQESHATLLVCFAGKTGWVSLAHVFGAEPDFTSPGADSSDNSGAHADGAGGGG